MRPYATLHSYLDCSLHFLFDGQLFNFICHANADLHANSNSDGDCHAYMDTYSASDPDLAAGRNAAYANANANAICHAIAYTVTYGNDDAQTNVVASPNRPH